MLSRLASRTAAIAAAVLLSSVPATFAQTATTDPVGFVTLTLPAGTDTAVGLPLTRPSEFTGGIASVNGNVITVSSSPAWTNNQFVRVATSQPKTYYALIGSSATSNPREGRAYTVIANDANTLTVNLNGDNLTGVVADTSVTLIPYWTLATVFPAGDANVSFVPSASAFSLETQVLIPDYATAGINLAPKLSYFFLNGAWRQAGNDLTEDHSDDILAIQDAFIVRNNAVDTRLTTLGGVLMKKLTIPLTTEVNTAQDNFVSVTRPLDVKLADLGLIASNAFVASSSVFDIKDQLLVLDDPNPGINKAAGSSYIYLNNAWRKLGQDLTVDFGNDVIKKGAGFIVRKAPTVGGATAFWTNTQTY